MGAAANYCGLARATLLLDYLAIWRLSMPLTNLIVALIVIGVLLYLVNNYIPMDSKIKQILNVVIVIAVVVWLLQVFGLMGSLNNVRVGG
jgi:hypothetical protein